jgi:hypothetical protein
MQLLFGIGALWGQRTDIPGVGPDQFAILQENSIDFTFEVKELYSQLGYPVDIARGKGKVTGKAKLARVFAALYADLFFGEVITTGESRVAENEVRTLSTSSMTVANASTFVSDLGVYYNTTGALRFTMVTGAPTVPGTYAVNTSGTYTFATGDVSPSSVISVSYIYTDTQGKTVTINNQFMGYTPTFIGTFYHQRNTLGTSGQLTLRLNQCVSSHLTFPSRIDDYAIPDFDWQAFAAGNNVVGTISTTE